MENKKFNILSSFIIKIIALLTMTIDHVGYLLDMYSINPQLVLVMRIIGRFAMPLFCFMIFEGTLHTKSFGKYILRLGIVGVLILVAQIVMQYGIKIYIYQGNIFLDLILGAVAVKALMSKKVWVKSLALLPLAYGIISFILFGLDGRGLLISEIIPYYIRPQYDFYGILLIICFYFAYSLRNVGLKAMGLNPELFHNSNIERMLINVLSLGALIVVSILRFVLGLILSNSGLDNFVFWMFDIQNWALVSGAFILLYSGQRGYNGKWFQYGSYLYYPVHLLILGLIFLFI